MDITDLQPKTAEPDLREEIVAALVDTNPRGEEALANAQADEIMALLRERGHIVPGAPPAVKILDDARSFAERLTLTMLALRILNMLAFSNVVTPESKGARKWIEDYIEGKNHGPAGKPMLWPGQIPGLAQMLRDWGFMPTIAAPGAHAYVTRALPRVTVQ